MRDNLYCKKEIKLLQELCHICETWQDLRSIYNSHKYTKPRTDANLKLKIRRLKLKPPPMEITCAYCQKKFIWQKKGYGNCCSKKCWMEVVYKRRMEYRRDRWTKAEENLLIQISGSDRFTHLVDFYNKYAQRLGLKTRTRAGLRFKIERLGISSKPLFNGFNGGELAQILGLNKYTVRRWIKMGWLKCSRAKSDRGAKRGCIKKYRILTSHWRQFCWEYPQKLKTLDEDVIALLYGHCATKGKSVDDVLLHIRRAKFEGKGHKCRIARIDTGEVFESITAAAKHYCPHNITAAKTSIRRSIAKPDKLTFAGTAWRKIGYKFDQQEFVSASYLKM